MKKLLTLLLLLQSVVVTAFAGDFYVGLTSSSSNLWSHTFQAPVGFVNGFLGGGSNTLDYSWMHVTDTQGTLKVDNGSFVGFKARDLFRNFSYGVVIGYNPFSSPFDVYVKASYNYRQFRMQPDRDANGMEKYQIPSYSVGIGTQITPLASSVKDKGSLITPFVDLSASYNHAFSCRAPYGNSTSQFGSGVSLKIGLGVGMLDEYNEQKVSVSLNFEMPFYNYFNRDFITPSGTKPYENIKSKYYIVGISVSKHF